jgi:hypothetical protein
LLTNAKKPLPAEAIAEASAILAAVKASGVRAFGPPSKRLVEAARAWGSDAEWELVRGVPLKGQRVAALSALLSEWSSTAPSVGEGVESSSGALHIEPPLESPPAVLDATDASAASLSLRPSEWQATLQFLKEHRALAAASTAPRAQIAGTPAETLSASAVWGAFESDTGSSGPPPLSVSFASPLFAFRMGTSGLSGATLRDAVQAELDGAKDLPDS